MRRSDGFKNPLVKAFAVRLQQWRKGEGRPLKEVAGDLDVSIAIICEWEHGNRFPSVDHLYQLARYTGIPASEFIKL